MTREINETLIYKTKRKPREDGLTDDECIALNLFWRKHIKVPILAKVFRVSKNTVYYRALNRQRRILIPTHSIPTRPRTPTRLIDQFGLSGCLEHVT